MTTTDPSAVETARYKVFLNKTEKNVLVLRYPHLDRDRSLTEARSSKPLEIRLKPRNGLIELDIPLPDTTHINPRLAAEYGVATNQHSAMTNGGPVGIAGGFGAAHSSRIKRQPVQVDRVEDLLIDFGRSLEMGRAMNMMTLTGQVKPLKATEPAYYLGNFQGEELHLTRVSAICNLSVGLHHLDARDVNEKAVRRAAQEEETTTTQEKASLVGMQVKSLDEAETEESELKRTLRDLHEEPWQKLEWVDEGEQASFDIFHDKLFADKSDQSRRTIVTLSDKQYLDIASATRTDPVLQSRRIKRDGTLVEQDVVDSESESSEEDDAKGRRLREESP